MYGCSNRPPPVAILEVAADRTKVSSESLSDELISIPPGRGELEFHYTALSFRSPEKNRFQYKLEGVDTTGVDAGTRRVAYYDSVPPGDYAFHVLACDHQGVWNDVGTAVRVRLLPHFWQTTWFQAMLALVSVGSVAGAARYLPWKNVQTKLLRLEQQHAVERERTRIARDMHDDLGARLTGVLPLRIFTPLSGR